MEVHKLETGNMKLDGGAMFGVVPKVLWQKVYPADENNLCNISMRSLLIEAGSRKIIIDTGIGEKQDPKFFGNYYLNGTDTLEHSLLEHGLKKWDITDVIHTHLHFDHCGGSMETVEDGKVVRSFPNAVYWYGKAQWDLACNPNRREKASYLDENFMPALENGQVKFLESDCEILPGLSVRIFNGHTEGQLIPFIQIENRTIVFIADLIPTTAHIPLAWICGYDVQPLVSLKEKEAFLNEAFENNYILFFQHDLYTECCSLKQTEKGIRMDKAFTLSSIV